MNRIARTALSITIAGVLSGLSSVALGQGPLPTTPSPVNPLRPTLSPTSPQAAPREPAAEAATSPVTSPKRPRSPAQLANDARLRACGQEWRANKPRLQAEGQTWRTFSAGCRARLKAEGR